MNDLKKITASMKVMKLPAMATELEAVTNRIDYSQMSALEVIGTIVDAEMYSRRNNSREKRIKKAHLSNSTARLDQIDYRPERRINKALIDQLADNSYINAGRNVLILGATGCGKSYISNALAVQACDEYNVCFTRLTEMFTDLARARLIGDIDKLMKIYTKTDLLVIDDFLLTETTATEQRDLMEIFEYRGRGKATILCSQLSPAEWHQRLGGGHIADAMLDRITNNAYTIELFGESLRKR